MKLRHKRLALVAGVLALLAVIGALVVNAMRSNLVFFYTPTQVAAKEAPEGKSFRIGGLVVSGSLQREGVLSHFVVTDGAQQITVRYRGALPDLFKEGKGVVAQGKLEGATFVAREVLAKHDENYMPPEAAAAMKAGAKQ
ncbi:cytochrome c maturation protein CcmE [Roseateles sp.]|uniref:cytochrome c maturation protein CcmE n=1 Tax=Roseateles sp. TaxID=1971397 RepID=UPI00393AF6FC